MTKKVTIDFFDGYHATGGIDIKPNGDVDLWLRTAQAAEKAATKWVVPLDEDTRKHLTYLLLNIEMIGKAARILNEEAE